MGGIELIPSVREQKKESHTKNRVDKQKPKCSARLRP